MAVNKKTPPTSAYYVSNDARLLGELIDKNWSVPLRLMKKPVLCYTPDYDVDTFDYSQGEVLCYITADDLRKTPKGIGFDGYNVTRNMHIRLRGMSNDSVLATSDEIERIINEHAINPFKGWNLMHDMTDIPLYPYRKFVQRDIFVNLLCYWKPRVEPNT